MTIPGSANPLLLASAAAGGYAIERSVRFNSSDSAYLSRTPASAGNRKTWTWAGWVKLAKTSFNNLLECVGPTTPGTRTSFMINDLDKIDFFTDNTSSSRITTTRVFRDYSAWYHIVLAVDTPQATASNRVKIYVNGSQVTTFSTATYPSQNLDTQVNNTQLHTIGRVYDPFYANMYLADVHFIDGQALDPTSFGEFDDNGIWQPIDYSGSFGTNGFHLPFDDNSTAAALGTDSAGSNDWTVNNISVASGAGNDSVVDVPTNGTETDTGVGGEVRGNYATLNPNYQGIPATVFIANGNLETTMSSNAIYGLPGTICFPSSGKWYAEVTMTAISGQYGWVGITDLSQRTTAAQVPGYYSQDYAYGNGGLKLNSNSPASYGASWTTNDVIGIAVDCDAGTIVFYKNGLSQGTAYSGLTSLSTKTFCFGSGALSTTLVCNFGQRPFAYTAPSGFKALNTANLPEGAITTSGTFTGNANADGPFVYLNGVPTAMTINGNTVTFATHADKLSNGFKLRTSSTSYNTSGSNTYSVTTTGDKFKFARAQPNP